jgi:HEPN domain-containing protein
VKIKRQDLRGLAMLRLREAQSLLRGGYWSGAYYLAGYAVECAIKACRAKGTERYEFPDKRRVDRSYTHKLDDLLGVAGLAPQLREAELADERLASNWSLVTEWTEEARYKLHSETDATAFLEAVQNRKDGVLSWLKQHW